ncbi:MAG: tetratricopeptide repeat protein [Candidatus Rokuibacteriota bacterium]
MSRRLGVLLLLLATASAGCASWSWRPWQSPAGAALARADQLTERGEYAKAVAAYDDYLARYPDDGDARRALQTRDALATIGTLRQEVTRLRDELAKLRTDLERLKQLDLGLERRR